MKKILFITPYFGRSGSEMQLFYILQNLDATKYQLYLFSRDNGELLKLLPNSIKHFAGYKQNNNFLYKILRLLLYAVGINPIEFQLRIINKKIKPDFWYINTIANRDAVNIATKLGVKIISHIHELPFSYSLVKYPTIQKIVENSILCIGCSKIVCEKLRDMGHKNVQLLYGFVDEKNIKLNNKSEIIKNELGINQTDFVWVISGHATTTKGVDFLIPLIKKLSSNHKIIWIGKTDNTGTNYYAEQSVKVNFSNRIIFTGSKSADYYDYFNVGDAYLSLSREDSFPLVMIEAAHLGKPIVGFNSGGINEFVTEKLGIVVNQLDYTTLAQAMETVKEKFTYYDSNVIKNYAKQFNPKMQADKLIQILDTII